MICAWWPFGLNAATLSQTPRVAVSGPVLPAIGTEVQSAACRTPADWMIGMSAGEPLIMPILPCANSFHRSVRLTVPGLGSVSPAATRPLRKVKAATLAALLMVYLPAVW